MRICVVSEVSAADKNADILSALEASGQRHVINAGMTESGATPELTYLHTGLISALLLYLERVDFVVGGCGTGQGYLNAVMQYPGVFCGHILSPLDSWLFTQINGGNCVSLALNQGYGWAGDTNLRFIFERMFSVESGCGYPPHRRESQQQSRLLLERISSAVHLPFARIIDTLPDEVARPALCFPGIAELLDVETVQDGELKEALQNRL